MADGVLGKGGDPESVHIPVVSAQLGPGSAWPGHLAGIDAPVAVAGEAFLAVSAELHFGANHMVPDGKVPDIRSDGGHAGHFMSNNHGQRAAAVDRGNQQIRVAQARGPDFHQDLAAHRFTDADLFHVKTAIDFVDDCSFHPGTPLSGAERRLATRTIIDNLLDFALQLHTIFTFVGLCHVHAGESRLPSEGNQREMKAAVLDGVGQPFQVQDIDICGPTGREVLIDVRASGLCHSDMHVAQTHVGFPMPAVLGHEVAGVVAEIGPDVTEFRVGDHVVSSPIHSCGHCRGCLTGRPYQCRHPQETQRTPDQDPRLSRNGEALTQFIGVGGFAEQVIVHENTVVSVSSDIPFDRAALLGCGVVTGAGAAINSARIRPGDTVAVIGCGGVGLNVIQGAALAGARRIIAIDLQPGKLELAKVFGATDASSQAEGDSVQAVKDLSGGGVTCAFEVIGLKQTRGTPSRCSTSAAPRS